MTGTFSEPRHEEEGSINGRFEHGFHPSNEVLPEDQQNVARALIFESTQALNKLNSIDDKTHSIQDTPKALFNRGENEALRIERVRIGVTPHKAIPTEVLSLIFTYTVDGRAVNVQWRQGECPWSLIQVCARWRAIALSEAQLWRTMTLIAPRTIPAQPLQLHQFLQSLNVEVEDDKPNLELISKLCAPHHNLTSLKFQSSPKKWLRLGCKNRLELIPHLLDEIRWDRLTTLVLSSGDSYMSLFSISEIISRCVNLVTTEFAICVRSAQDQEVRSSSLRMAHLRSLKVHTASSDEAGRLLALLTLPVLETFSLSGNMRNWDMPFPLGEFMQLINRSCCSLKHFTSNFIQLPSLDIKAVLTSIPELLSLILSGTDNAIPLSVLDRMTQGDLVPNLEVFVAYVSSLRACRKLLAARYQGIPSAQNRKMANVKVTASRDDCQAYWEEFRPFVKENEDEGRKVIVRRQ